MQKEAAEMTNLTVYRADGGAAKPATSDIKTIISELKAIDIRFERWPTRAVPKGADPQRVLELYQAEIEQLKKVEGMVTVDAMRITPDAANAKEIRAKFLAEHTHDDDEVRFFVEGAAAFYIRSKDLVYKIVCTAGDLICVPRGTKHWADTGAKPDMTVVRFFTNPQGWEAAFTGDDIAKRIPLYEPKAA
jgi:1,2-dihydroxy-3-keto-5-methylthiopentene dioxygenase